MASYFISEKISENNCRGNKKYSGEQCSSDTKTADDRIISGTEMPFPHPRPGAGPVSPHINSQAKHRGPDERIGYQRDDNGRDGADLSKDPGPRVIPTGKLCLVDPFSLYLESRDEPERDNEHEDIVNRHVETVKRVDEVPGLRRDKKELEDED